MADGWDDVAIVEVAVPSNAVSAELVMMAFDADHGRNDPSEGELYINENPPIGLVPDGTQAIGAGVSREVRISIPLEILNNGENTFRFVKVLNTGYNIESAMVVVKALAPPTS